MSLRALLSVSDKTNLLACARSLAARGVEIISTGGTARTLIDAGIPVVSVSEVTGLPEMMDGRVKTLHPAIHAGILARRTHPGDCRALEQHRFRPIDLVIINLYPFARAAASDAPVDALVEEIDVGGPALIRAAAKNFKDVLICIDPADYEALIEQLDRPGGPALAFRLALARKAFAHTAAYDAVIARTLVATAAQGGAVVRVTGEPRRAASEDLPDTLLLRLPRLGTLRYGENPHQAAALYGAVADDGFAGAQILQGKELSYTNLLDLDAAARLVLEFAEPAVSIVKHTNPCGVAVAETVRDAYVKAREADPLSAFGGIVALNRAVDRETAEAVTATFIEAIVVPEVQEEARSVLAAKRGLRVLVLPPSTWSLGSARRVEMRSILGAVVAQHADEVEEGRADWPADERLRVMTRRPPTESEWRALRFAWRVCAHVKSNAVVFTASDRTLAIGAGQMSRVDAVKVAIMKATAGLQGSVAASDAFFPFRDGIDALAAAGATAVVQPGGSVRDEEAIAAADEHGLAMVFTGRRHFRH
jgi:phosphoribosylaminoimidazolecarboxamide formyltransferase / IMP cyclohydrolase